MKRPQQAASEPTAPVTDPEPGQLVAWIRPGLWRIAALEERVIGVVTVVEAVLLAPADDMARQLVGERQDGRPVRFRTEVRYLRSAADQAATAQAA